MDEEELEVHWHHHGQTLLPLFHLLFSSNKLVDVTLACEGKRVHAHRLVLAACSDYLQELLVENTHPHPIIYMKDVKYSHIVSLLEYMYTGKFKIPAQDYAEVVRTAEGLKIRGFDEPSENMATTTTNVLSHLQTLFQDDVSSQPSTNTTLTQKDTTEDLPIVFYTEIGLLQSSDDGLHVENITESVDSGTPNEFCQMEVEQVQPSDDNNSTILDWSQDTNVRSVEVDEVLNTSPIEPETEIIADSLGNVNDTLIEPNGKLMADSVENLDNSPLGTTTTNSSSLGELGEEPITIKITSAPGEYMTFHAPTTASPTEVRSSSEIRAEVSSSSGLQPQLPCSSALPSTSKYSRLRSSLINKMNKLIAEDENLLGALAAQTTPPVTTNTNSTARMDPGKNNSTPQKWFPQVKKLVPKTPQSVRPDRHKDGASTQEASKQSEGGSVFPGSKKALEWKASAFPNLTRINEMTTADPWSILGTPPKTQSPLRTPPTPKIMSPNMAQCNLFGSPVLLNLAQGPVQEPNHSLTLRRLLGSPLAPGTVPGTPQPEEKSSSSENSRAGLLESKQQTGPTTTNLAGVKRKVISTSPKTTLIAMDSPATELSRRVKKKHDEN